MASITRGGTGSNEVRQLTRQVERLEKRLAKLKKCVQVDAGGQNLTLKVPANITIEAGAAIDIKGGTTVTVVGARIDLN